MFRRFLVRKRWHLMIFLASSVMIGVMINACEERALPTFISPLPSPSLVVTSPPPTPEMTKTFPTSQPGMGTVRGALTGMMGGDLYLAKLLPDDDFPLFELGMGVSPKATICETGEFTIIDVPPGRYGLVFWTPLNSFLINDPRTGTTLIVTVQADKLIDLGKVTPSP